MGYQEMVLKVKTDKDIKRIENIAKNTEYVDCLAVFKNAQKNFPMDKDEFYFIVGGERFQVLQMMQEIKFSRKQYTMEEVFDVVEVTGKNPIKKDQYKEYISFDYFKEQNLSLKYWSNYFNAVKLNAQANENKTESEKYPGDKKETTITAQKSDGQEKLDKLSPGRRELVEMVIENLNGNINPWIKKWNCTSAPRSAITGKAYVGVNNVHLTMISAIKNYEDPRWATFNQINKAGWHLQAGSKGSQIEVVKYYDKLTKKDLDWDEYNKLTKEDQSTYWEENVKFILQGYTVFNATKIDGIPALEPKPLDKEDLYVRAQKIFKNSEAKIYHDGGARAFYRPGADTIHLPDKSAFTTIEDYYSTGFHEIGHSTGHEARLNRKKTGMFGSAGYAKEELVAEVCSMFVQQDIAMPLSKEHIENHSAYIKFWREGIKEDPNYLFEAITQASRAANFVLSYELDKTKSVNNNIASENVSGDATNKRIDNNQQSITSVKYKQSENVME